MKHMLGVLSSDLGKTEGGNKAASQRVRTGTIKFEKLAKVFRKESIAFEKRGGMKKKAAKKTASKKKTVRKKSSARKKAAPKKSPARKTAKRRRPASRKSHHSRRKTARKTAARRKAASRHAMVSGWGRLTTRVRRATARLPRKGC
jgi:hypothetical protein